MSVTGQFRPFVTVTQRDDGNYDLEFDWFDCFDGAFDGTEEVDDEREGVQALISAVDDWIAMFHRGKKVISPRGGEVQGR